MLLVTNMSGEVVGVDGEFLKEAGYVTLKELNRAIYNGDISIGESGNIVLENGTIELNSHKIFTIFGNFILYTQGSIESSLVKEERDRENGVLSTIASSGIATKVADMESKKTGDDNDDKLNLGSLNNILDENEEDKIVLGSAKEENLSSRKSDEDIIELTSKKDEDKKDEIDLDTLFKEIEKDVEDETPSSEKEDNIESEEELLLDDIDELLSENKEEIGEDSISEDDELIEGLEDFDLDEELTSLADESKTENDKEALNTEKSTDEEEIDDLAIFDELDESFQVSEDDTKEKKLEDTSLEEDTSDDNDELLDMLDLEELQDESENIEENVNKEEESDNIESVNSEDELMDLLDLNNLEEESKEEDKSSSIDTDISEDSEDDLLDMLDLDELEEESSEDKDNIIEDNSNKEESSDDELLSMMDDLSVTDIDIDDSSEEENKTDLSELDIIPIADDSEREEKSYEDSKEIGDNSSEENLDDILGLLDENEMESKEEQEESHTQGTIEDIIPLAEDVEEEFKSEESNESKDSVSDNKSSEVVEDSSSNKLKLPNISLDLDERAKLLEIDTDEYKSLFMDFISDSREMRDELISADDNSIEDSVSILKDAVMLLQLDTLKNMLDDIERADKDKRVDAINRFFLTLDAIESQLEDGKTKIEISELPDIDLSEEEIQSSSLDTTPSKDAKSETKEELKVEESKKEEKSPSTSKKLTAEEILDGVKPIPIEFSLHLASEELSLPEDLVLEFISDFAQQAHENLPILIEEYRNNELDKLQKTAHMLKGAASNLRIEQMVDNLYQLQYDNNIDNAPERIRLFAGQLMGLDNYLKQMNVK